MKIKPLVEAYGLNYLTCEKDEDLSPCIARLLQSDKASVLEMFTDSDLNTENYKGYFRTIKETPNP